MQLASVARNMTGRLFCRAARMLATTLFFLGVQAPLMAQEVGEVTGKSTDQKIDEAFGKATGWFVGSIFSTIRIGGYDVLWVVLWLAAAGLVFTLAFKFINIRAFPLALRTVRGKYSRDDDPGDVTHFQALTAAVSGTVGLGNIAGVAIGITMGGPGVAFWLFLSGFLGMATKFAECTLGVKYREMDPDGHIHGGGMQYLRKGFAERGLRPVGTVLAIFFAIFCVFASFGGGNVFQINQATAQLLNVTGGEESYFASRQWLFGVIVAVATALVIIGGIRSIARVTSKLVPLMCMVYVVSALIVLIANAANIPMAIREIVQEAFTPRASVVGGVLAAFIWGMRRATFSNEAGIGSAPIAHSAAKTRMPASEGVVALLEPFIDTVIVCTMTSLVLVTTMHFNGDAGTFSVNHQTFELGKVEGDSNAFGIGITSLAFETVHGGFKYVLFACVLLFAFSTLITWSYYGLQAWRFLFGKFGKVPGVDLSYKLIFCLIIVAGASAKMSNAVDFSDASLFAMSIPNLIGVYFLMPVVARELGKFLEFTRKIDDGETVHEAWEQVEKSAGGDA
ncbi:alanine/glycine:cation symporter family protein [Haloferula sargassicola]|uniref:Amino-acid carrier protein AlsT n=1 Tax=Haloferula sargassicola TaxID=490096 RepID=A0ABP9UMU9_9BACT